MLEINTNLNYKDFIVKFNKGEYDEEICEYFRGLFEVDTLVCDDKPECHVIVNLKDKRTLESNYLSFEEVRDLTDEQIVDLYNFLEVKKRIIKIYESLA